MNETEIAVKLAEHENRIKVSEHRIEDLEAQQKVIQELTISVHDLAKSVQDMCKELMEQKSRIAELEKVPAENWKSLIKTAITAVVSALVGAAMAGLIK